MKFIGIFLFTILSFHLISVEPTDQRLIIIRHGEAENNIEKVYNSNPESPDYKPSNLTKAGIHSIEKTAKDLIAKGFFNDNIVAVFVSPLPRAKQTADILVQYGLASRNIVIEDSRLIELNAGDLEGKPSLPVWKFSFAKDYHTESEEHLKSRTREFYHSILKQYPFGNIIIVTHIQVAHYLTDLITHQNVDLKLGEAKVFFLRSYTEMQ